MTRDPGHFGPVLDALPDVAWVSAGDGTVEFVNRAGRGYFGLPMDDLLAWDWGWVVHPADLPNALDAWSAAVRSGTRYDGEYRLRRHDGEYRWFTVRAVPRRDRDGAARRWFGTCTDVDDARRAADGLRATQALFRALVERSDDGYALLAADRTVRYVSPAVSPMLGHLPEVVAGTAVCDWVHPDDRAVLSGWLAFLLASPGMRAETAARLRHRGGSYRAVAVRATNLLPDPDVRAVAVTFRAAPADGPGWRTDPV